MLHDHIMCWTDTVQNDLDSHRLPSVDLTRTDHCGDCWRRLVVLHTRSGE